MGRIRKMWDGFEKTQARIATLIALVAIVWSITWTLSQKMDIGKLTKEYAIVVSKEMSDLETRTNDFAERSDEMLLGETIRMIVASQGNTQRAFKNVYEKALEEGQKRNYIFEINQASDGVGFGFFMTEVNLRPGEKESKGSSYLLTTQEKKNIEKCLRNRIEEVKREKQKNEFVNGSTQEEMFRFLLRHEESGIGCITEQLSRQFQRPTLYGKNRIEVMTPPGKLGAIIGHIGDLLKHDESETSEG